MRRTRTWKRYSPSTGGHECRLYRRGIRDLDEVLTFIASNYPSVSASLEQRLRAVERRIGRWPVSAEEVAQRPGIRVVPLLRYPYKIFYQVTPEAVEILHIHHVARREPWRGE